eukprot:2391251-Pyramimonas_sp.AAC.1
MEALLKWRATRKFDHLGWGPVSCYSVRSQNTLSASFEGKGLTPFRRHLQKRGNLEVRTSD